MTDETSKSIIIEKLSQRADELERALGEQRRLALELESRNEDLARLSKLKDYFVGVVSHDLRSPLTNIKGYTDLLQQDSLGATNSEQKNALNVIQRNCTHLLDVLDKLLDISRIESGEFELHLDEVDIVSLANERIDSFRPSAEAKGISLHSKISPELRSIRCDRDRIASVLDNLLSNAVKFCPSGGEVFLLGENLGIDMVGLAVKDNGPGIPSRDQHKLFKRFARISIRPTGGEKTIGLGLSIVKDIVELHDGKINAMSQTGKGSTFFVSLPCAGPKPRANKNQNTLAQEKKQTVTSLICE